MKMEMVDLKGQYRKIQAEVDQAILNVIAESNFINGPQVQLFAQKLSDYLGGAQVIPCANGTDALQIAMMALGLRPGDEVIVPAFTYVATAEVIGLLHLTPVLVDVEPDTFNLSIEQVERFITPKTKAIVPVHLFGQCANMDAVLEIANRHNLFVIEDAAQALGADFLYADGRKQKAGTIGHIGCTSFFPSKNLGCYGDGGALFTKNEELAESIRMIANHGQVKKYVHTVLGVNSRLDTVQAAILSVKLEHLDEYCQARQGAAEYYNDAFRSISAIQTPNRSQFSTHVFHQYTLVVPPAVRDTLKDFLQVKSIPSMIYYPIPLHHQEAFRTISRCSEDLSVTERLCKSVISLPIHTEMTTEVQDEIIQGVVEFFTDRI
jgi:UDP-2-acetamido-2-deoxy-ribo-hexuluronate aminotransferase